MQRFITILTLFALLSAPCINAQRAKSGGTRVRNNAARVKNTPVKEKEIPAEVVEQMSHFSTVICRYAIKPTTNAVFSRRMSD